MAMYTLKNESIAVWVETLGAELKSLKSCADRKEYMWNADPAYWKRTSPVLFPLVGNYKNKEVLYDGHVYGLSQHGFARDMEFDVVCVKQDSILMSLHSNSETRRKYPFDFTLEIGYELMGRSVKVTWRVKNENKGRMYFSIGGHPAFNCPIQKGDKRSAYYVGFEGADKIVSRMLGEDGLATDTMLTYELEDGLLPIRDDLFEHDALIIENHQTHKVTLHTPDKKPYVTVSFDCPLFGVWSVPGKEAPFVCIEPWYGRCDNTNFTGTLEDREWGNTLEEGGVFEASYTIEV